MLAKNYVYNVIDKEKKLWLRNKNIVEKLGVQNIYDLVDKEIKGKCEAKNPMKQQIRKYMKLEILEERHGSKLTDGEKILYTLEDIIMPIIVICRVSTPEATGCRSKLGFKQHDIIFRKKPLVILKRTKLFWNEKILLQHSVLGYRIDLYFP